MRPARVLLCPDKFRGTFTAAEVCAHLERGLHGGPVPVTVRALPLADGGEGTLDLMTSLRGGERVSLSAPGPSGRRVHGEYLITPDGTAVIESARFIGLSLLATSARDPMRFDSRGVGHAVADALDAGARRLVIGLGGSATVDGGAGMAVLLGFRLLDAAGREVGPAPGELAQVAAVDAATAHPGLAGAQVTALCDVPNPLLGANGAARVFGPQKGASEAMLPLLETGLETLARAMGRMRGLSPGTLEGQRGAGAAGGLGAGCAAFLGAHLVPGAGYLMEEAGYTALLASSDLVVTGEGSYDRQSHAGKVVAAVLAAAGAAGKPVIVVAGAWDGTTPTARGQEVEVLTGRSLGRGDAPLGPGDLEALGRMLAGRVAGPDPPGTGDPGGRAG